MDQINTTDVDVNVDAALELIDNEAEQVVQVELTIEQIVDQILDAMKLTEFTMYQVAKALNLTLETIDATKGTDEQGAPAAYRVRPQMVYNYNQNKMVVKGAKVDQASLEQTRAFVIKFATKFAK